VFLTTAFTRVLSIWVSLTSREGDEFSATGAATAVDAKAKIAVDRAVTRILTVLEETDCEGEN
jgi:hypothetical protein